MADWVEREHTGTAFDDVDLSDQELLRCRFTRCRFVGACLSEMRVRGCQFSECDFSYARMNALECSASSFSNCRFHGANLFLACFEDCRLLGAILTEADLGGADGSRRRLVLGQPEISNTGRD